MLRSPKFLSLTLVCGVLSTPSFSFAWSVLGHKIVGKIAEQQLTPQTKKKFSDILDGESVETAAAWPDAVKDSAPWKHTKGYHYKNIDANVDYFSDLTSANTSKRRKGDLVLALLRAEDILRDTQTTKEQKKNALRFFIHFFADLHQPLHAGYYGDSGGNAVPVTWYGVKTNLHSLWDNKLIISFLNTTFPNETKIPIDEIIASMHKPSASVINSWNKRYYVDWLNEAITMRDLTYKNIKSVNDTYYQTHIDTVIEQMQKGGHRLAYLLENVLNGKTVPEHMALKQKILGIIGPDQTDFGVSLDSASTRSINFVTVDALSDDSSHDCDHEE